MKLLEKKSKEEEKKYQDEIEEALLYQEKLFGNIEFAGELYRRKILPEATIITFFEYLLGIGNHNNSIDDFYIEGAIILMEKVG